MWALSTCGEPGGIKKNTHPKSITALSRKQVRAERLAFGVWEADGRGALKRGAQKASHQVMH